MADGIELVRLDVRRKEFHDGWKFLVFVGCNDTSRLMKHKIGVLIALNDLVLKKGVPVVLYRYFGLGSGLGNHRLEFLL